MKKKKILVLYGGYLPGRNYGGPVRSLQNLVDLLGDDVDFYIICSDHDMNSSTRYTGISAGWDQVGKAHVRYLSDSEFQRGRVEQIVMEIGPDVLYTASIFSAKHVLMAMSISTTQQIPLLLAPRGELSSEALKRKKIKKNIYLYMLKRLKKFDNIFFQATSDNEKKDIKEKLTIPDSHLFLLPNVPSVPKHKEKIEKKPNGIKMCYVGRIIDNKNLLYALKATATVKSNVEFDVYGSIEDSSYWKKCVCEIEKMPLNIHVKYSGILEQEALLDQYKQYDCLISPTEFENYGQALVEAMLHDVPIIVSKGTTPWDEIGGKRVGYVVPLDTPSGFTKTIEEIAKMSQGEYGELIDRLRNYCLNKFRFDELRNSYIMAFIKMMDGDENDETVH